MKTIALYSIKGGVGKTAATVNLSFLAASASSPVLVCDLDPQGASSFYFRITASRKYNSEKFLKGSQKITRNIKATDHDHLDLLPSDLSYRNLDLELAEGKSPRKRLSKILEGLEEEYSFLILDCPPNLTLLSESVFRASDLILVPLIPTTLSIRTFEQLFDFFRTGDLDSSKIAGFFSMEEKRKSMHREAVEQLREHPAMLKQTIPYSSDVEKMGLTRAPLNATNPGSPAAQAYAMLWEEVKQLIMSNG
jgi:cellulose biosynthesis protein BcsQ